MISLSPRLQRVADLVPHGARLADIGCGHAKVCFYCLQHGLVASAVGVDCSAATLQSARLDAERLGLDCEFRLGDGLAPLAQEEASCVVIAGMGGNEIVDILSAASYCAPTLVLVPHKNPELVRKYLYCAGYAIDHDTVVWDAGHWYCIIKATAQQGVCIATREQAAALGGPQWYVGKDAVRQPDFARYRLQRLARLQQIVAQGCSTPDVLDELAALTSKGEENDGT